MAGARAVDHLSRRFPVLRQEGAAGAVSSRHPGRMRARRSLPAGVALAAASERAGGKQGWVALRTTNHTSRCAAARAP